MRSDLGGHDSRVDGNLPVCQLNSMSSPGWLMILVVFCSGESFFVLPLCTTTAQDSSGLAAGDLPWRHVPLKHPLLSGHSMQMANKSGHNHFTGAEPHMSVHTMSSRDGNRLRFRQCSKPQAWVPPVAGDCCRPENEGDRSQRGIALAVCSACPDRMPASRERFGNQTTLDCSAFIALGRAGARTACLSFRGSRIASHR